MLWISCPAVVEVDAEKGVGCTMLFKLVVGAGDEDSTVAEAGIA